MSEPIEVTFVAREFLVSGVAVAGCTGITLLWVIDLLVYHRLLDSCFVEGLILEKKHAWLPRFRHNMMKTQEGEGVLFRVVGFYLGPVVLLILVAGGVLSLWLQEKDIFSLVPSLALVVLVAVLAGYTVWHKTENTAAIAERLSGATKD